MGLIIGVVILGILVAIAIPMYRDSVGQTEKVTIGEANMEQKAWDAANEANVHILNSATTLWVSQDPTNNDPRRYDTDTLRPLIENHLTHGWPVSPSGGRYVLEDGQWIFED